MTKKKSTAGTRGVKKLALKKETLKDLDAGRKRIKGGGAAMTLVAACAGRVTVGCGGNGTGTIGCQPVSAPLCSPIITH